MNANTLREHVPAALEAVRGFLAEMLGQRVALRLQPTVKGTFDDVKTRMDLNAVVLAPASGASFAVVLEAGWVPLLSQVMVGEELEVGEAVAMGFLRDFAERGYGAVRARLGTDASLPDLPFEVLAPYDPDLKAKVGDSLWIIPFAADQGLGGFVALSAAPVAASAPPKLPQQQAIPDMNGAITQKPASVAPAPLPDLGGEHIPGGDGALGRIGMLADVELEVTVELGRRRLPLADVLRLTKGSVIELEKFVGEPLHIYANGRLIAEGEAVVVEEQFGVRITRLAAAARVPV